MAGVGGLFVSMGMDWYNTLTTPSQTVPNIAFSIVWSIIYITAIVVLCLWTTKDVLPKKVFAWFIINGVLNVLWCLVFFTFNQTLIGVLIIILNLISSIFLWLFIYKQKPIYSYFLSLYPIWICFATALNLSSWILN